MVRCAVCKVEAGEAEISRIRYNSSMEVISGMVLDGMEDNSAAMSLWIGDSMPKAEVTREINICSDCFILYTKAFFEAARNTISAMTTMWVRK